MRPGFDSSGRFMDYVPHPDHFAYKLRQAKLLPQREDIHRTGKPDQRRPMGRDYMSGDDFAAIEARRHERENKVRLAVTLEASDGAEKIRAQAAQRLKGSDKLTPEERTRLEAIVKSSISALVAADAERLEAEIKARLAVPDLAPAKG